MLPNSTMGKPKDAKIWNEDLVTALRAREEQARQQGSQYQFTWRDGAQAVEQVRSDIYAVRVIERSLPPNDVVYSLLIYSVQDWSHRWTA